jgi:hypothetical protein
MYYVSRQGPDFSAHEKVSAIPRRYPAAPSHSGAKIHLHTTGVVSAHGETEWMRLWRHSLDLGRGKGSQPFAKKPRWPLAVVRPVSPRQPAFALVRLVW